MPNGRHWHRADGTDASVNNYMANVVAAVAGGAEGRFQPFVSGGVGAMQIRGDVDTPETGLVQVRDTQLGSRNSRGARVHARA